MDRESGLRLDRNGRWHHQGVAVTHERLARALSRWLDRDDESGRFVLRVSDDFWAYVEVEDAPYQAALTDLAPGGGLALLLSDGTQQTFTGPAIRVGADDAWYVPVKDGRFEARLGRGAMVHLADYLEEDAAEPEGVVLVLPQGLHIRFAPRD